MKPLPLASRFHDLLKNTDGGGLAGWRLASLFGRISGAAILRDTSCLWKECGDQQANQRRETAFHSAFAVPRLVPIDLHGRVVAIFPKNHAKSCRWTFHVVWSVGALTARIVDVDSRHNVHPDPGHKFENLDTSADAGLVPQTAFERGTTQGTGEKMKRFVTHLSLIWRLVRWSRPDAYRLATICHRRST